MGSYQALFRVQIRHHYFSDDLFKFLVIRADRKTEALMAKRAMLLRVSESALTVLCPVGAEPWLHDPMGSERMRFCFNVYAEDPDWRDYTETSGMPRATQGIPLLFVIPAGIPSKDGFVSLTPSAWASSAEGTSDEVPLLIDTLSPREILMPPIAVLNLLLSPQELYLEAKPREYSVRFNARSLRWKYFVMDTTDSHDPLSITDADKAIEFEPTNHESERLSGRNGAYAFISRQEILLQERYEYRFQLHSTSSGNKQRLVDKLPYPAPGRTGMHQLGINPADSQDESVLEIYVNL